ncbi:MAG: hypothetical protein E6J78_12885 [Deltaproteobacteria bacterium]|nr:MAG: hypothetical protein E6J78_12885 [Deltaproteobacteria bacterium]
MTAREYIETIAQELSKARGRGLLLSPADAQLALQWHAAQVPLQAVLTQVRRAARLRPRTEARGATDPLLSLQLIASAIKLPKARGDKRPEANLREELRSAARSPGLAARSDWETLAETAEELLAEGGGEGYWTAAVRALRSALRELPRESVLEAGSELRSRLAPRPSGMPRRRYQRSLQLMLLSACSERLGLPPRAFLL